MSVKLKLPKGIDYKKYYSTSGMNTRFFGPAAWNFLFVSILGHYPIIIKTSEDKDIRSAFKNMLTSLPNIMPCIFCRNSFKKFLKKIPIEPYLIGKIELMFWLYQMKDLVNKKLICQENKCYNDEKSRLKKMFYNKKITKDQYYEMVEQFKKDTFVTILTPSFQEILDKYESQRANCNRKAKKCSLPIKK